jgi:hypothetical protein
VKSELILDDYRARQGWNEETCLTLALEFINQQRDNAAWEEYLRMTAELENEEK